MQILEERGETAEPRGQKTFSILLFEDLAIVPLLAVVAVLAPYAGGRRQSRLISVGMAVGGGRRCGRGRPLPAQSDVPRSSPPPRRAR